jgi:hypothetical protein
VIEWEATERVEVLYVALPPLSVPVASVVLPSLNVTVPVAAEGVTVAVNVTDIPKPEGFSDDVKVVVEVALFTVCARVVEVLVLSLASPP